MGMKETNESEARLEPRGEDLTWVNRRLSELWHSSGLENRLFPTRPCGACGGAPSRPSLGPCASPVNLEKHLWTYGTFDSDVIGVEGLWGFTASEELGTPRLVRVDQ